MRAHTHTHVWARRIFFWPKLLASLFTIKFCWEFYTPLETNTIYLFVLPAPYLSSTFAAVQPTQPETTSEHAPGSNFDEKQQSKDAGCFVPP